MGISQLPLEWPQNLGGKAYHLYQDFSDSDKKLAYLDLNYNKEVRWGYYPTHPSPTSGRKSSEEFVSVLEGGEWDDLDGVDQFPFDDMESMWVPICPLVIMCFLVGSLVPWTTTGFLFLIDRYSTSGVYQVYNLLVPIMTTSSVSAAEQQLSPNSINKNFVVRYALEMLAINSDRTQYVLLTSHELDSASMLSKTFP